MQLTEILDRGSNGEYLDLSQALRLWEAPLIPLLQAAHARRESLHPQGLVTYVKDRNINFTDECVVGCQFCAFHKPPGQGRRLGWQEIRQKVQEAIEVGVTQLLMQGGIDPGLGLADYTRLFRSVKAEFPQTQIHSLSPPEIHHLAEREELSIPQTLEALQEAGLDSLPGGGAEILVDRIRESISPGKGSVAQWVEVMRVAHGLGMPSSATMMYGAGEDEVDRLEHLLVLRSLQEETGGFIAFIPWPFQRGQTPLGRRLQTPEPGAWTYLRLLAIARLVLVNIPHIQVSWVTQGPRLAQVALFAGADDFGSTMLEENVVRAAGTHHSLHLQEMLNLIREAGFTPAQRRTDYSLVQTD